MGHIFHFDALKERFWFLLIKTADIRDINIQNCMVIHAILH